MKKAAHVAAGGEGAKRGKPWEGTGKEEIDAQI